MTLAIVVVRNDVDHIAAAQYVDPTYLPCNVLDVDLHMPKYIFNTR